MNQIVTTTPQRGLALPTEAIAMMQLATQLSTSRTIPSVFQKSPADCFNVLAVCVRFGFDFYSTIWECSIISGRLFYSGKMVHAMLNSSGYLAERLNFDYGGEGEERHVMVTARIGGENEKRSVKVMLREVRTKNENWNKQPDQQLSYAGARIWGRRHLPEVLLGMLFEGETIDITPTVVTTPELPAAQLGDTYPPAKATPEHVGTTRTPVEERQPEPNTTQAAEPAPPAEPFSLEPPADPELWREWCQRLLHYMAESSSLAEVLRWRDVNDASIQMLQAHNPRMYRNLENLIDQQKAKQEQPQ
jgi:hypothetical protein